MMTPHIRALAALLYNTILLSWWLEQVLIVCKNSCFCWVQRPLATLLLFLLLSWSASVQSPGHGAAVVVRRGNWRSDVWSEDSFTSSNSFHWSPPSHHTTSMSKLEQGWRWLGKKKVAAMVGKEESSCRAHAEKFQIFISVIFFYMDMFMFLW